MQTQTMMQRPLPSAIAIETEAARIERMIEVVTKRLESSNCDVRTFMHLQVFRTELQTYFAGLQYALGYTNLLDPRHVGTPMSSSNAETFESMTESLTSGKDETLEKGLLLVQCFEC